MDVTTFSSLQETQNALVEKLAKAILDNLDGPVLLFYSGGSALDLFEPLYEALKDSDLSNLIFAPVDERKDESASNARALAGLGITRKYSAKGVLFLDFGDYTLPLEQVADSYNEQLKLLIKDVHEHEGIIVTILGMGPDGHTAGIFPYPEDPVFFRTTFINTERFVVGYNVGEKNLYKERVTLTVPALQQSDYTFVYVVGKDKQEGLKSALEHGNENTIPARLWNSLRLVELFTTIDLQ